MRNSSSGDDSDIFSSKEKKVATRRSMKSLFAEDDMQSRHGVTSLRYEDQSQRDKAVSRSVMGSASVPGAAPNAPSPLQTAAQSVAMAYRGNTCVGPCVVALCVPHHNALPAVVPLIAIVDREKQTQCRVRLDASLQLIQNCKEPQYATLYDPSIGGHWTLMLKDRRGCTEFVTAVAATQHCDDGENRTTPLFVDASGESTTDGAHTAARSGDGVTLSFMMWLLRRVPNTRYFALGKLIEEVPPEAPRDVLLGDGTMMAGVEEALAGIADGAARIVFVSPRKVHVRRGLGNPEIAPGDTVVVHVTCHTVRKAEAAPSYSLTSGDLPRSETLGVHKTQPTAEQQQQQQQQLTSVPNDPNALLHAILLQTLQQQQQQQQQPKGGSGVNGGVSLDAVERSMDRIQLQMSSLYEKIDRLGIEDAITKNNLAIERIVKKAVGRAPTNDIDLEDAAQDRDGLLATIEQLKLRLTEATENYHRALEAMGRHKDEVHHLQNDLRIQQETHDTRLREVAEQRRLQLVETEVRHRQALDRVTEEKYAEGRAAGVAEGMAAGRQDAFAARGEHTEVEWQERLFAAEQRVVALESSLQQREAQHIAERCRLQERADALLTLTERLERRSREADEAAVHSGPDSVTQRCKTLRRAMNAAYTNIETQLYAAGKETVPVEDVLQMVLFAVKSETRAYVDEIKKQAALRWDPDAVVRSSSSRNETVGPNVEYRITAEEIQAPKDTSSVTQSVDVSCLPPAPSPQTPHALYTGDTDKMLAEPPILQHGAADQVSSDPN